MRYLIELHHLADERVTGTVQAWSDEDSSGQPLQEGRAAPVGFSGWLELLRLLGSTGPRR